MAKSDFEVTRDSVRQYYDEYGWKEAGAGLSGEDAQFRSYPLTAAWVAFAPRRDERVAKLFEGRTGSLLVVGGGDLPDAHLQIAERFDAVTCVDISSAALDLSRARLGEERGRYVLGSITDADLGRSGYDAALAAHVVYHIHKDEQEAAVRRMISVAKPGARIVIVYSNPNSFSALPGRIAKALRGRPKRPPNAPLPLYFHAHHLGWWKRFSPDCRIAILPWFPLGVSASKILLRNSKVADVFFSAARAVENLAPSAAARLWHYPIIVLDVK